jgi:hypothetical protein
MSTKKALLEFTRFPVDISIVLGLGSCVTKAKWKNGKREKQKVLWIFFPFSPLSPFSSVLHFLVQRHLLSSRELPVETIFLGLSLLLSPRDTFQFEFRIVIIGNYK